MRYVLLGSLGTLLVLAGLLVLLLRSDRAPSRYADDALEALDALRAAPGPALPPDSPAEAAALDRFRGLFADFSPANVRSTVRTVYAEALYFNDTVKTVRDLDTLAHYLEESAAGANGCTVEFLGMVRQDGDYYLRWLMQFEIAAFPGRVSRTVGMTHLRFDGDGRVVYHQDYWDPATGIFEHLPAVGWMIRKIKDRL